MEEANAECLLVRKADGSLAGIVSERDCLRRCVLKGRDPRKTRVSAIMTREVVTATPGARISRCMNLMHRHHIRHLPIVRRGRPLAIVSMQDLVRFLVSEKDFIIKSYEDYISGG
jgi:CBS domain-containing protein